SRGAPRRQGGVAQSVADRAEWSDALARHRGGSRSGWGSPAQCQWRRRRRAARKALERSQRVALAHGDARHRRRSSRSRMMRYRFIDEVLSLDLGARPRIEVVKTFAVGDDALSGPLGPDRVPNALILEFLAMTGGHLAFRHGGARRLPLLLKVPECRFEQPARAGDRLRAIAQLDGPSPLSH